MARPCARRCRTRRPERAHRRRLLAQPGGRHGAGDDPHRRRLCLCHHPEGGQPGGSPALLLRLDGDRRDQSLGCRASADRTDGAGVRRDHGSRADGKLRVRGRGHHRAGIHAGRRHGGGAERYPRGHRPGRGRTARGRQGPQGDRDQHGALPCRHGDPLRAGSRADLEPARRGSADGDRGAAGGAGGRYRRTAGRVHGGPDRSDRLPDLRHLLRRTNRPDHPQQSPDRRRCDRDRGGTDRPVRAGPDREPSGRHGDAGPGAWRTVVTFGDVATVRRAFDDPTGFARIDGQPALALEVTKRSGANIIETVAEVRAIAAELQAEWPEAVRITWLQDQSEIVQDILSDLEANVIAAVVLVMIVIVYALGLRSAILVGLAIPGAFLAGVTGLWAMDYTMNIVVLFSLILVVGMLVDGAIVTTELADRHLQDGATPRQAYAAAAKRMAWPIIASTATTLSVFFPLLFWSGMVGEFMKFLPITVILTLTASLFMALIFIPVVGGLIGRRQPRTAAAKAAMEASE